MERILQTRSNCPLIEAIINKLDCIGSSESQRSLHEVFIKRKRASSCPEGDGKGTGSTQKSKASHRKAGKTPILFHQSEMPKKVLSQAQHKSHSIATKHIQMVILKTLNVHPGHTYSQLNMLTSLSSAVPALNSVFIL